MHHVPLSALTFGRLAVWRKLVLVIEPVPVLPSMRHSAPERVSALTSDVEPRAAEGRRSIRRRHPSTQVGIEPLVFQPAAADAVRPADACRWRVAAGGYADCQRGRQSTECRVLTPTRNVVSAVSAPCVKCSVTGRAMATPHTTNRPSRSVVVV